MDGWNIAAAHHVHESGTVALMAAFPFRRRQDTPLLQQSLPEVGDDKLIVTADGAMNGSGGGHRQTLASARSLL
jgi:hypothetical protein